MRASRTPPTNLQLQYKLTKAASDAKDEEALAYHRGKAAYELGIVHWNLGDVDAALASFAKAVEDLKDSPIAWFYLAEAQRASNKLEEAKSSYEQCLQLKPHYGRAAEALLLLTSAGQDVK